MARYDLYDSNHNYRGTAEIDEPSGSGSADFFTVPAVILYLLGFFGMGFMMANIPETFIFVGILALLIYASPLIMVVLALILRPIARNHEIEMFDKEDEPLTVALASMLTGGGGIFKNILKHFIAPYAYVLFNVTLAVFWISFMQGTVHNNMLIAFIVPSAYSMYYYPFMLIRRSVKTHSKLLLILSISSFVVSLALFLCFYDAFMQTSGVLGLGFFFTMITVFGTLLLLVSNIKITKKRRRKRNLIVFGLYLVLIAAVAITATLVIPARQQAKYDTAMQYIQEGKYDEAREALSEMLHYKDSAEQYDKIKFKDLSIGDEVTHGSYGFFNGAYGNWSKTEGKPIVWVVIDIDTESGKALMITKDIVDFTGYNGSWKDGSLREYLNEGEFAKNIMGSETIYDSILTTNLKTVIGGETVTTEDKFFVLSKAEYEEYSENADVAAVLNSFTYTYYTNAWVEELPYDEDRDPQFFKSESYYLRDSSEDEKQTLCVNSDGTLSYVQKYNRQQYNAGLRPACYISID